jgi:hypothetical protein
MTAGGQAVRRWGISLKKVMLYQWLTIFRLDRRRI